MNSAGDILDIPMAMPLGSDRDLVDRFRSGDREAFSMIYRSQSPALFRLAFHMTADRAKAAEITQDVFVWLVHHPASFHPERGELGAFLAGVARQFIRRRERKERRWLPFDQVFQRQPAPARDPSSALDAEAVRKAVAALPMRYREAVILCDLEDHSQEEAAALLGCAVGTVGSRLHRAHELLARKLQLRRKS